MKLVLIISVQRDEIFKDYITVDENRRGRLESEENDNEQK